MKDYLKKRMYKWHRIFGLLVLVPTLLWTVSGLMHPFMSHWFKTEIPNRMYFIESVVETDSIQPISKILQKHKIDSIKNIRIVQWNSNSYYQIKGKDDQLHYFNRISGLKLAKGDHKYAEHIARKILEDSIASIQSMTLLKDYTSEYKSINRLLPVWKVSFDRPDKMDIYVETAYSKFSTFNDSKQKAFIWIFSNFHNWNFLSFLGNRSLELIITFLFICLIFLSSLSGILIYGFHWKYFKKPLPSDALGKVKRQHRKLGISFSLISLLFAFSGAYHLTKKFTPDERHLALKQSAFEVSDRLDQIPRFIQNQQLQGLVRIDQTDYIQTQELDSDSHSLNFNYYNLETGKLLEKGTEKHAFSLLKQYCNQKQEKLKLLHPPVLQTAFTSYYGFVNKRLPVMVYELDNNAKSQYYIEPATGHLAAYINKGDVQEGLSFAFLHKFHFLDGLGKNGRDGILVGFAFFIALTSVLGIRVFIKKRKIEKSQSE
jgi:hypothetical protein